MLKIKNWDNFFQTDTFAKYFLQRFEIENQTGLVDLHKN